MVDDNHTLHVRFTNFSLEETRTTSEYDELQFFETVNGSFTLIDTFRGKRHRQNLTATTNVKFVFISNDRHNSTGFRADYFVFITPGKKKQFFLTIASHHETLKLILSLRQQKIGFL